MGLQLAGHRVGINNPGPQLDFSAFSLPGVGVRYRGVCFRYTPQPLEAGLARPLLAHAWRAIHRCSRARSATAVQDSLAARIRSASEKSRWHRSRGAWPPPNRSARFAPEKSIGAMPPAPPGGSMGGDGRRRSCRSRMVRPLGRIGQIAAEKDLSEAPLAHQLRRQVGHTVGRGHTNTAVGLLRPSSEQAGKHPLAAPPSLGLSPPKPCSISSIPEHAGCHSLRPGRIHVAECALRSLPPDRQTAVPTSSAQQGHRPACGQAALGWSVTCPCPWGPPASTPLGRGRAIGAPGFVAERPGGAAVKSHCL